MTDEIKEVPLNTTDNISKALSSQEQGGASKVEEPITPESPIGFDITKLSKDQLQTLKAMLSATTEGKKVKKEPTIRLREIDGKVVVAFKNAFLALVDDLVGRRKVEEHMIPVLYRDAKDYVNVLYKTFINSKQIICKVIKVQMEPEEVIEGETISRETGTPVDMVRKGLKYTYTVKLPDDTELVLSADVVNG